MKIKFILSLQIFIIFAFNSCLQRDINLSDFSWDTSIDQIVQVIGKPNETESSYGIIMNTYKNLKFHSYDAILTFIFLEEKLVGGFYDINSSNQMKSENNDRNYYINVYNNLMRILIGEHGNPLESKEIPNLNMGNERGKDALLRMEMPIYSAWYSNGITTTLVFQYQGYWSIQYSMFTQKFLDSQN